MGGILGRYGVAALSVVAAVLSPSCSAPRVQGSRVPVQASVEPVAFSELDPAQNQIGNERAPKPVTEARAVPAAPPEPMSLAFSRPRVEALSELAVDWASVDRMNLGSVSFVELGPRWGMAMSSGQDRLEECEPTLALTHRGPGFSDTFLFVSAIYRLSPWAHLVGSITGVRIQDQALSEAVDDAEFSSATIGVYFQF